MYFGSRPSSQANRKLQEQRISNRKLDQRSNVITVTLAGGAGDVPHYEHYVEVGTACEVVANELAGRSSQLADDISC